MIERVDEVKKAKAQIVEGSLTIWNARLDTMVRAGDLRSALAHVVSPIEWGDNCGCNVQCGGEMLRNELIEQMKLPSRK